MDTNNVIFMGIDIGTTSTKGIIADGNGVILEHRQAGYPMYQPEPAHAEQDPDEIAEAVWQVMKQLIHTAVAKNARLGGIGFSSAMHSVILVDEQNRPLTRCVIWADNRSAAEAEEIKRTNGLELYRRTGTPIHPMSPLTKLLWMSRAIPEQLQRAYKVVSIKEYVLYQLCGRYVIDHSIASTTGLFHLEDLTWDREALALAGIREEQLSQLVPVTERLQIENQALAHELGIPLETPLVIGASDGVLANLGAGALDGQTAVITIGTSGAVRTMCKAPQTDRHMRGFCYALLDGYWITGGPTNNGGISLQWFREQFAKADDPTEDSYASLIKEADACKAGAEGLLFLPYLTGERAPYWNPLARGMFFGIGLHHRREHLLRAVLEGVIFSTYSVFRSLPQAESGIKRLYATGGFVQSPLWLQMTADIFGLPVHVPVSPESACMGAVMVTMLATGAVESVEAACSLVQIETVYTPNEANTAMYQELHQLFEQLYHSVEGQFEALAKFR